MLSPSVLGPVPDYQQVQMSQGDPAESIRGSAIIAMQLTKQKCRTILMLMQCGGTINCPAEIQDTSLCGDRKVARTLTHGFCTSLLMQHFSILHFVGPCSDAAL